MDVSAPVSSRSAIKWRCIGLDQRGQVSSSFTDEDDSDICLSLCCRCHHESEGGAVIMKEVNLHLNRCAP